MSERIYILKDVPAKKSESSQAAPVDVAGFYGYEPAALKAHIKEHDNSEKHNFSVVGLMEIDGVLSEYLFFVRTKNDRLCYSPLKTVSQFGFRVFFEFDDKNKQGTTPEEFEQAERKRPAIPPDIPKTGFFSEEQKELLLTQMEKEQVQEKSKEWNIVLPISGSLLTPQQQEMLLSKRLCPSRISFLEILDGALKEESQKNTVLQAMIASSTKFGELSSKNEELQLRSLCAGVLFEFFSPDRLNQFSSSLYPKDSYHPTIGDLYNFYTHCIQEILGSSKLDLPDLHQLPPADAKVELGDQRYHFSKKNIYNEKGLIGRDAIIFEFLASVMQTQNIYMEKDINEYVVQQLNSADIGVSENTPDLLNALGDVINTINTGGTTQLIENLPIYQNLLAMLPSEDGMSDWKEDLLPRLEIAQCMLLAAHKFEDQFKQYSFPDPQEEDKILQLLKERGNYEAALILLDAHILDYENFKQCVDHFKPVALANSLAALKIADMLDDSNRKMVVNHENINFLSAMLVLLSKENILDAEIFKKIINSEDTFNLNKVFVELKKANILNVANAMKSMDQKGVFVYFLYQALEKLNGAKILNNETFKTVLQFNFTGFLADSIELLSKRNMLTPENLKEVAGWEGNGQFEWSCALYELDKEHILTADNFKKIAAYPHPNVMALALVKLKQAGISDCANLVENHRYPRDLVFALMKLQRANILNPTNRDAVGTHEEPLNLASALIVLDRENISDPESLKRVVDHKDPESLASALMELKKAGILDEKNLEKAASYGGYHATLVIALQALNNKKILDRETFEEVLGNQNFHFPSLIRFLNEENILDKKSFKKTLDHKNISRLYNVLLELHSKESLNIGTFEQVVAHKNPEILVPVLLQLNKMRKMDLDESLLKTIQDLWKEAKKEAHYERMPFFANLLTDLPYGEVAYREIKDILKNSKLQDDSAAFNVLSKMYDIFTNPKIKDEPITKKFAEKLDEKFNLKNITKVDMENYNKAVHFLEHAPGNNPGASADKEKPRL